MRQTPMATEITKILLIEQREILREGVKGILHEQPDLTIIAEASSGALGLSIYTHSLLSPDTSDSIDVVLTALELPDMSGIDVLMRLKDTDSSIAVVVLALNASTAAIREAISAGVDGFILLDQATKSDLVLAIRSVAHGGGALSPSIARLLMQNAAPRAGRDGARTALSARELQVLRLLATGETSKEIGVKLGLSSRTIDNHRIRILDKLGANSTAEAIVSAIQRGLLD